MGEEVHRVTEQHWATCGKFLRLRAITL